MKSLQLDLTDNRDVEILGRASVQIVHDLKNQLNGLKLYATFLRRRMEKTERPADELETVLKLIAGLERAAADMNALVRYGRPFELRRQPGVDLLRLVETAFEHSTVEREADGGGWAGVYDSDALAEAFQIVAASFRGPAQIVLRHAGDGGESVAVCEINTALEGEADPFHSFTGSAGMRMALAGKIFRAHGGDAARTGASQLQIKLPSTQ